MIQQQTAQIQLLLYDSTALQILSTFFSQTSRVFQYHFIFGIWMFCLCKAHLSADCARLILRGFFG